MQFCKYLIMTLFTLAACSGQQDAGESIESGEPVDRAAVTVDAQARFPMLEPCSVPWVDEELLCGRLDVLENREDAESRTISLHITVVPTLSDQPEPDPLFDLAGGPGTASGDMAGVYVSFFTGYRENRDIVLVDQRGSGKSHPLHCDLRTNSPNANGLLNDMYPSGAVEACRRELEQNADLTMYTTDIFVQDLDEVRQYLGFDRINLAGLSYGTRAAMQFMRRYPEYVRSAVLMGVVTPSKYIPTGHTPGGTRALQLLLDDCIADEECGNAFPEIRDEFTALLARLDSDPPVASKDLDGERYEVMIRRDQFAEYIRSRLGSSGANRGVPLLINSAFNGNYTPYLESALPGELQMTEDPFLAEGLYLSVTCAEDLPFVDEDEAARINAGSWFGNYRVEQQLRACENWPRAGIPEDFHEPLHTGIPVLMISGRLDQVTPPKWADEAAAGMTNIRHIVLHHGAHVPAGLSNLECLDGIMSDFMNPADPAAPDESCTSGMLPPAFETGY